MSDRITVIHAPHEGERGYYALSRDVPQDERLSFEARGVLCYLLSKPSNWLVQVADLQKSAGGKKGTWGRDKVYRILGELRACGYLHRDRIRKTDGTFEWGPYRVYEKPFTENTDMDAAHQEATQPLTEKPDTVQPDTDNPYTENTEVVKTRIPHQEATQPYPPLPYTENTEILKIRDSTDQRFLEKREGEGKEGTSPKSTPAPFFEALAELCCMPMALATQKQRADLGSVATKLNAIGATVEQLGHFKSWWFSDSNWRTRKATETGRKPEAPKPTNVLEEWGNAMAIPVVKSNGARAAPERPPLPIVQPNPSAVDPAESRRKTAELMRELRGT